MRRLSDLFGCEHPVALVTGSGAARVGNAIARRLAERGYRCVVHARNSITEAERTVAEINSAGGEAIALRADLTNDAELAAIFAEITKRFGQLDVLVNAAAIWEAKPLEETTSDDVRRHLEANAVSVFAACRAAGLIMAKQPHGGAIVNLGDWATARPYLNYAAYFPSKGAVSAITRDFAVELAHRNPRIRVNAVLPGPVMLPFDLPAEDRAAAIAGTLLKREGSPAHVADAVLFLIENDFITGVSLPVDGGRTIAS